MKKNIFSIILMSLAILFLFTSCGNKNSSLLKIDDKNTHVYNTEAEAKSNPIQLAKGGSHILSVSNDARINGKALEIIPVPFVVKDNGTHGSKHEYTMDLSIIPFHTTLMLEVTIGGEDSFVGQRLYGEDDAEKYYIAVEVITDGSAPSDTSSTNDTQLDSQTTQVSNDTDSETSSEASTSAPSTTVSDEIIPNGIIYFGEDRVKFNTYPSEWEAQQAAANSRNSTLPTYMVKDGLLVEAEPDEGTARIRVKPCLVDQNIENTAGVNLYQNVNWSGVIDVSEYAGHQVTFVIHAGNLSGFSNGYSYVSVFIPEF